MAEPDSRFAWTQDVWVGRGEAAITSSGTSSGLGQRKWLVRFCLLGAALLVFEYTASAALTTAIGCMEFGRADCLAAWWLWRTDPDRSRGRLCSLCFLTWALTKVWFCTFVVIVVILTLIEVSFLFDLVRVNPAGPLRLPFLDQAFGAAVLLGVCLVIAWVLAVGSITLALRGRRKVWIGAEIRLAQRAGLWPPSLVAEGGARNRMIFVKLAALLPSLAFLLCLEGFIVFQIFDLNGAGLMFLAGQIAGTVLIVIINSSLERRVVARTPADCWPTVAPGVAPAV